MTTTLPPIETANAARAKADRYRAEWLISVAEGFVNPMEVFRQAATTEGAPLLKLSLRQVLLAQPGWGKARTTPRLEMLRHALSVHPNTRLTVGWLLDPRAGGRRYLTFLDIFTATKILPPWPGFPWSPAPSTVQSRTLNEAVS